MDEKVPVSKQLVVVNTLSATGLAVLRTFVFIWVRQHLAGRIPPEEYQLLPLVLAVMILLPMLSNVITAGLGRFMVEAYAKGDERRVTQIASTMGLLAWVASAGIAALGLVVIRYADAIFDVQPGLILDLQIMLGLSIGFFVFQVASLPYLQGFYVRQRFVIWNALQLCGEVINLTLLFALLFGVSSRVVWVIAATVAADTLMLPAKLWISRKLLPACRFSVGHIHWPVARGIVAFGSWSLLGSISQSLRNGTDPYILNRLATSFDVTCYDLGIIAHSLVRRLPMLIVTPLAPPLTAIYAAGDHARLGSVYLRAGRYALWSAGWIVFPLMIFAHEIVAMLIGPQYHLAATVMVIALVPSSLTYGNVLVNALAQARGMLGPITRRTVVMQTSNVLLTIVLVGPFQMGALGAAVSTLVMACIGLAFFYVPLGLAMADVRLGRWLRETVIPGYLPSLAGSAVWLTLKLKFPLDGWLELGFSAVAGGVCYAIVLLVFCLRPGDRNDLKLAWRTIRAWIDRKRGLAP